MSAITAKANSFFESNLGFGDGSYRSFPLKVTDKIQTCLRELQLEDNCNQLMVVVTRKAREAAARIESIQLHFPLKGLDKSVLILNLDGYPKLSIRKHPCYSVLHPSRLLSLPSQEERELSPRFLVTVRSILSSEYQKLSRATS